MIDFTGPWEVFQDVMVPGRTEHPVHLYTVSESTVRSRTSSGMNPDSNHAYSATPVSTAEHPLCVVCGMDVDPANGPKSVFKGATYYFCSDADKKTFDAAPDKFVNTDRKGL